MRDVCKLEGCVWIEQEREIGFCYFPLFFSIFDRHMLLLPQIVIWPCVYSLLSLSCLHYPQHISPIFQFMCQVAGITQVALAWT